MVFHNLVHDLAAVSFWILNLLFVVENFNNTLSDEVDLLDVTFVTDDSFIWGVNSAEHIDDELIGKSSLTLVEEVVELLFELSENIGVLDQLGLHFWSDLLVEREFFDHKIEIVFESLFNVLSDIAVKSWLDVEWFVRLLDLLYPHIKVVELLFDKVIERVRGVEDTVDGTHQEGEERKT